jgi:hypothetical protein
VGKKEAMAQDRYSDKRRWFAKIGEKASVGSRRIWRNYRTLGKI